MGRTSAELSRAEPVRSLVSRALRSGVGLLVAVGLAGCASVVVGPEHYRAELDRIDEIERTRSVLDPSLKEWIQHESPHVRARVFQALARIRSEASFELWRAGLAEEADASVIATAAFAAGQWAEWGAPRVEADEWLWRWTDHEDPAVRTVAYEALGERLRGALKAKESPPSWADRLSDGLDDDQASVRGAVALALEGGTPAAVDALITALETEEHPEVHWRLVYALARRPEPESAAALVDQLGHWNPWVRLFAAQGVANPVHVEAVPALRLLLEDDATNWTARVKAVESLGKIRAASAEVRDEVRDLLVTQLQRETQPLVLESIVEELVRAEPLDLIQPFIEVLASHESLTVRRAALVGLGEMLSRREVAPDDESLALLHRHAQSESPYERAAAIRGLGATGQEVWEDLTRALEDEARVVRTTATEVVAKLPTEERWDLLSRLTRDADLAVRTAAVQAYVDQKPAGWLGRLDEAFEGSGAQEYWECRKVILSAWIELLGQEDSSVRFDRGALEARLRDALQDSNPGVVEVARRGLGVSPDESGAIDPASRPYPRLRREQLYAGDNLG